VVRLTFAEPRRPPEDDDMVEYLVKVEGDGLRVESPVLSLAGGDGLPTFLEDPATFEDGAERERGEVLRINYGSRPRGPTEGTSIFDSESRRTSTRHGKLPCRSPSRLAPRWKHLPRRWRGSFLCRKALSSGMTARIAA